MEYFIHKGIPYRIAVCRCELGNQRADPDTIEADDTTYGNAYDNITGAHPRPPRHAINGVTDSSGQVITITAMSPWSAYPTNPPEGELIAKARGGVDSNGDEPVFPSIQITLRPLKSELQYQYTGNTNKSGEGEDGTESEGSADSILDTNLFYGIDETDDDGSAHNQNYSTAKLRYSERGGAITLNETHYYHNEDRPPDAGTPFEPQENWEIDVTLFPNLSTEEPYGFSQNETWDSRYRYPVNETEFGSIWWSDYNPNGQPQNLMFTPFPSRTSDENPIYPPENEFYGAKVRGICPVMKGWYWDGGSFPNGVNDSRQVFTNPSFKLYKYIRKRYSFSFNASDDNKNGRYAVMDNNPSNVHTNYNGGSYDTYRDVYYFPYVNQYNEFNCTAWWRMEINTELCEWNYDKKLKKGWKIKGTVLFAWRGLDAENPASGNIGGAIVGEYYWYYGGDRGIWPGRRYDTLKKRVSEDNVLPYVYEEYPAYEGGGIPFEVEVTETNAQGRPIAFLDFPIGGETYLYNSDGTIKEIIKCGTKPENSIVYISDFFITSIEPPTPPTGGGG